MRFTRKRNNGKKSLSLFDPATIVIHGGIKKPFGTAEVSFSEVSTVKDENAGEDKNCFAAGFFKEDGGVSDTGVLKGVAVEMTLPDWVSFCREVLDKIGVAEIAESKRLIHEFFELTYANYLAIPRSILQSMPEDWQLKFVHLLEELNKTFDWRREGCEIRFRDERGRYMGDALADYERGRLEWTPEEVKEITERHNADYARA